MNGTIHRLEEATTSHLQTFPFSLKPSKPLEMSKSNMVTIKFLCSYSGRIVPRYPDGKLRYLGGETRVLSVDRSIAFSELLLKLGDLCGTPLCVLRCQLPTEDLDALVSITSDEDLANLIEEYDRASPPPSSLKIRAFLSPPKSAKKISPTPSSASSSSSTTSTSPKANSGSTPRFLKTSPADRCPAPQISTAAGKLHSHLHQYQYQYHHQHHGYYAHRNSNSSQIYLVHNGNHWQ